MLPRSIRPRLIVTLVAAAGIGAAAASTVQRCEGPDGKVTYSNTQCPSGTQPVRKVNTDPPVSVDDQKAAKERTRRDVDEAKKADKQRKEDEAKAEREAGDRRKVEAKDAQKCDKARRDLDTARSRRADLGAAQPATIEQIQKAESEIRRRESDLARDCPR
jgi:hypothetical protein